jgi:hypothetical protein
MRVRKEGEGEKETGGKRAAGGGRDRESGARPISSTSPPPPPCPFIQAAVTPSLKNLLNSVIAGGVVLTAIVVAVSAVSGFDPINTRK